MNLESDILPVQVLQFLYFFLPYVISALLFGTKQNRKFKNHLHKL